MGEEPRKDCRSWEEDIYWSHFQYIHFSQFLHAGFEQRLAIPEKFARNLKSKLPDTVNLKSPCGALWEVSLTANENTLFFDQGWQEFVKDHSLQENDILVFKYNGESRFDVLVFNGQSMCENAASYFLRKREHEEHDIGCQTKRKNSQNSAEVVITSPGDGSGSSLPKKPRNKEIYTPVIVNKKAQRGIKFNSPTVRMRGTDTSTEDAEVKPDIDRKKKVLQAAQATLTHEGFIAVMKPTHVSRKFFMNVPYAWITKHIACREKQLVTLRIKEKTWTMRLLCYRKDRNRQRGGLAGGWKNFVVDNKLHESDVCVFEPGSLTDKEIILDVNIFRVVPL
ncbi:hypothetical protein JCGZ_04342 [Jatropha curcas]|uniref:TF-B3 domain-containing protein n=2 Tax=Jatropha curcas TaxID=180498 RepID=A0A067KQK2_JATCU|nr:hypothetical protein JCGZ_04342 [Jatropha curcas]